MSTTNLVDEAAVNEYGADSQAGVNIWLVVLRRKWIIVCALLVAILLGCLHYARSRPVYQSSTQVLVERTTPVPIQSGPNDAVGTRWNWTELSTQTMLIQSPLVIGPAVTGSLLESEIAEIQELVDKIADETNTNAKDQDGKVKQGVDLRNLPSLKGNSDPINKVTGSLEVEQEDYSQVLILTYKGSNSDDCKTILNAITRSYKDYLKGTRANIAKETTRLIAKAKDELFNDIDNLQQKYNEFRSESGHLLVKVEDGQNIHQSRQISIEQQRNQVQIERSDVRAQLETLQDAIAKGTDRNALLLLLQHNDQTSQILNLARESAQAQADLSDATDEIAQIDEKIQALEKAHGLEKSSSTEPPRVAGDLLELSTSISRLNDMITRLEIDLDKVEDEIRDANRESVRAKKTIEYVNKRIAHVNGKQKAVDELAASLLKNGLDEDFVDQTMLPLMEEKVKLVDKFGPDHPEVISVTNRISLARRVLQESKIEQRREKLDLESERFQKQLDMYTDELVTAEFDLESNQADYEFKQAERGEIMKKLDDLNSEKRSLDSQVALLKRQALIDERRIAQRKLDRHTNNYARIQESQREHGAKEPKDIIAIYVESLQQKIKTFDTRINELNQLFDTEQKEAKDLEKLELRDETFRSELARKQQLFDVVIKRLEEISLTNDLGGYAATVVSAAKPGEMVEPNLVKILLVACFLGTMGGVGLAYLVDLADKRYRSPEDIRSDLGISVLGHIPTLPQELTNNGSLMDGTILAYHKPRAPVSESYRSVRTALFFNARENCKVIQVTSPSPGDGKSTLASNLAVTMAQSEKKVLLIDCDFRKPRLSSLFGLKQSPGITEVIQGKAELKSVIHTGDVPNLFVVTSGDRPHNPSELLSSQRFEQLLEQLRDRVDYIVIDSPPILVVTDASNIAPRVDGVLLVLRMHKQTRQNAIRAVESLASVDADLLGVIVNGVGGKKQGYGYDGYGYGYGYGSSYGYGYGSYGMYGTYGDGHSVYGDERDSTEPSNGNGHGSAVPTVLAPTGRSR